MKHRSLALILMLGLAVTGCHRNLFTGLYSASAEIQVRLLGPTDQNPFSPEHGPTDPNQIAAAIAAEVEIMQSADVLVPVIRKLDLSSVWAKRYQSDHAALTDEEAVDHLHKVLKIDAVPETYLIKITAYSEVPQEAADIANTLVDNYKAMRDQDEAQRYNRGLDALRDQLAQQQTVLDNKRAVLERQRQALGNNVLTISGPSHEDDSSSVKAFRATMRDLDQQQSQVDALNVRLKQVMADPALQVSPVRILKRAVPLE